MPLWLRKIIVVLITVFTLGLVTPPPHLTGNSTSNADVLKSNSDDNNDEDDYHLSSYNTGQVIDYSLPWPEIATRISSDEELNTFFLDYTRYHANEQTKIKFGDRINSKIGDEFLNEISPKIEKVVASYCNEQSPDTIRNLVISNNPSSGYGEKIFHIYDARDGNDKIRVHVRREHPPQDGYWFSFHYHKADDAFQSHHQLGKLYWDRNMPPKWMA